MFSKPGIGQKGPPNRRTVEEGPGVALEVDAVPGGDDNWRVSALVVVVVGVSPLRRRVGELRAGEDPPAPAALEEPATPPPRRPFFFFFSTPVRNLIPETGIA